MQGEHNDNGATDLSGVVMDVGVPDTGEVVLSAHKVPYYYRQDIVMHKKSGSIGIVNDVAGDSDSDTSIIDDDDDEDDDGDSDNEEGEGGGAEENANDNKDGDGGKDGESHKSENLQADQVRVLWLDDTERIQNVNDITLVDRGFLHGDYVASAMDPTGQVGVVQDVNISVDLLAPDGSIVKDVSSRELKRIRDFAVGDYVLFGPWLGRVDDVLDNVTVLIDDGSTCKVMAADPMTLKPISNNFLDEDGQFPYYPGQRVRATSSSVFRNSRWLSGLWKAKRLEGTVTKVTVGSVFIYWIASAGYGPDSSTAPAEKQSPKNLKLMSCFGHANWQVGDWCLLPSCVLNSSTITVDKNLSKLGLHNSAKCELVSGDLENESDSKELSQEEVNGVDESMDLDQVSAPDANAVESNASPESSSCTSSTSVTKNPVHETRHTHQKKLRKVVIRKDKKIRKKEENFEKANLIVSTRTRVDVAWQDGTIGRGVDSKMLIPIDSPGDHEFVAEQYVVEKVSDDIDCASDARRVGVVQSVNAKERTACVRWLKPVERAEDPREFDLEEIVSVYELEGHPDYDYSYGDVVVRLSLVSVAEISQAQSAGESKQQSGGGKSPSAKKQTGLKNGEVLSGAEASTDSLDLSWVGNITGLRNGDIEVTWADGMVSTVGPQAIFVVGRDDDDDSIAAGSEVSDDDAASWETVNDDEMDALENAQEDVDPANTGDLNSGIAESNDSGRNSALSFPLAAIDFVTRLAAGIFSRRKNAEQGFSDSEGGMANNPEERDSSGESSPQRSNMIAFGKGEECADIRHPITSNESESSCHLETVQLEAIMCSDDETSLFKRFDTAKDPLDHHFLGSNGQVVNGRKWLKKIQQDWNILQNNLPDGIYVRVYEDRMDLLRAVIVGAYGTPYQDGLFFFDFYLPPDYPDVPPSAHYHSGGWRINPNLYEEGKVCLSLLNTWTGRGNEVWDPKSSSILQVLVSLQGLVLNAKPYFNEAGYDKQIGTAEGEKNSLSYNENTFLLNCKTMMYLMRKPPKDFEELIKEHFRRRGYYILKACDAYMKGSLIGSLSKDASVSMKDSSNSTSIGFKLMLTKIMPKLYSALSEVGVDCLEFKHLLQPEN